MTTTIQTRTVSIMRGDLEEYIEYLASEEWPVVRMVEGSRPGFVRVTFAV